MSTQSASLLRDKQLIRNCLSVEYFDHACVQKPFDFGYKSYWFEERAHTVLLRSKHVLKSDGLMLFVQFFEILRREGGVEEHSWCAESRQRPSHPGTADNAVSGR